LQREYGHDDSALRDPLTLLSRRRRWVAIAATGLASPGALVVPRPPGRLYEALATMAHAIGESSRTAKRIFDVGVADDRTPPRRTVPG
jgi:hypothetical protein